MKGLQTAVLVLLMATLASVAGCNTMEGAGQDIQRAGEALEEEASEH